MVKVQSKNPLFEVSIDFGSMDPNCDFARAIKSKVETLIPAPPMPKHGPVPESYLLVNALSFETKLALINSGSQESVNFTSDQLAGQYAQHAAAQSGFANDREHLLAELTFLAKAGARFDIERALTHAQRIAATKADK